MPRRCLALALFALLILVCAPTVRAQTTVYYVAPGGSDAGLGTSWAQAFATVTRALEVATGRDEIWIAEGTYTPSGTDRTESFVIDGERHDGIGIYGGFAGTETSRDARDPAAHPVVLSGDINAPGVATDNSYHVVFFDARTGNGITPATRLDGVTVTGGYADRPSPFFYDRRGAGGFCRGERVFDGTGEVGGKCQPTLARVVFQGNEAQDDGGGFYHLDLFNNRPVQPIFVNVVFAENVAGQDGGGLFAAGGEGTSSPVLANVVFAGNVAGRDGGGLYANGGDPEFGGNSFMTLTNVTFAGNTAGGRGGGLFHFDEGQVTHDLVNVVFDGNTASTGGDAIHNDGGGARMSHCLVPGGINGPRVGGDTQNVDEGGNLDVPALFMDTSDPDGPDGRFGTADDGLFSATGSPALDAGTNAALPTDRADLDGDGDTSEPLPLDLAGHPRIRDNNPGTPPTVDLGAYESPEDVVLPVELTRFTAAVEGEAVVLAWQTASETNNAGFAVEQRLADGGSWREVGFVQGAGTTTEAHSYAFRVEQVGYGRHAFRLRQIDLGGTSTPSDVREVERRLGGPYALSAYPNPFRSSARINLAAKEAQVVTVEVYDVLGRRVAVLFDGEVAAGQTQALRLAGQGLASGVYLVRVTGETFTATRRVTLVR
jgi:predicted outer membrane repeat protein